MLNRKRVREAKQTSYTRSDVTYNFMNMNSTVSLPQGAFVFQNKMIDRPLLLQAMNVVNLQEAIQSIDSP